MGSVYFPKGPPHLTYLLFLPGNVKQNVPRSPLAGGVSRSQARGMPPAKKRKRANRIMATVLGWMMGGGGPSSSFCHFPMGRSAPRSRDSPFRLAAGTLFFWPGIVPLDVGLYDMQCVYPYNSLTGVRVHSFGERQDPKRLNGIRCFEWFQRPGSCNREVGDRGAADSKMQRCEGPTCSRATASGCKYRRHGNWLGRELLGEDLEENRGLPRSEAGYCFFSC